MHDPARTTAGNLEKIVLANIAEFGWHAVNVIEDDGQPPWTYTIGLYDTWRLPELIIIGRSRVTAQHILETIANRLEANQPPTLNAPSHNLIPGVTCHYLEVHSRYYADYVGFARWHYRRREFPLYQIAWPGNDDRYPWDERAAGAFKEWQPILGTPPVSG